MTCWCDVCWRHLDHVRHIVTKPCAGVGILALLLALVTQGVYAGQTRIAVASNFAATGARLAGEFNRATGHEAMLSAGSTGKHYAQIINGAPFDILLAADSARPKRLEEEGIALAHSRFTYAIGRLVIWSAQFRIDSADVLRDEFQHLAIANEKLAPYGRASREFLQGMGLWDELQTRLVRGENVAQALQFVHSGNAQLGLVAASQVLGLPGSIHEVPTESHTPIIQQAVLLADNDVARAFLEYIQSGPARRIISAHGYSLP